MTRTVIRVEGVSKQYRLGNIGTGSFGHDLNRWWHIMRGKEDPYLKIGSENDRTKRSESEYVWALRNISFDVKQGDVVGIIGRNGAGKSTLLKILSRTTLPTTGNIKVRGRIASLLEVGTGFHPELSGRENTFLNGAILGMTKHEIKNKFDEIVDFAGIERYIDTPVKRYSSGMYVRLAFAVAAHLEPEILIVDEVLAVGDSEFQKKALGKMRYVSQSEGRTVLFVSHNIPAVKTLCNSGILLVNGKLAFRSNVVEEVVNEYNKTVITTESNIPISERSDRAGNASAVIKSFELHNAIGSKIEIGRQVGFTLSYESELDSFVPRVLISINNLNGDTIVFLDSITISDFPTSASKKGTISVHLSPDFALSLGSYFVNVAFFVDGAIADHVQNAISFDVIEGVFFKNGRFPVGKSICYVNQEWNYRWV